MSELYADVASMFAAHGITAGETPMAHDGYSGATMSRIEQDGQRYVVKRTSRTADWIIQMTSDHAMREAQIAASDVLDVLAPGLRSPSIAAARDGDGFALLMHDVTDHLLPGDAVLPEATLDIILRRVAQMHATFWDAPPDDGIGWCGLRERLLMLSEPAGERLRRAGMMEFGFAAGWERFHATASPDARVFIRALHDDPSLFIDVLGSLPQTLLQNDVKIGNLAIEGDTLWLFDWALAGIGPVACDLGWLLAVNSSRAPWTLDGTSERYASHLRDAVGRRYDASQWERQRAAAHVVGLMLFGFAKEGAELDWWCERVVEARAVLGL